MPTDLTALANVEKAWRQCPEGCKPILTGDLNVNLEYLGDERDDAIAEQVDGMDLINMTHQFKQRRRHRIQGGWTWIQWKRGQWMSLQCDYFPTREGDCRQFCNVSLRLPSLHHPYHGAVVTTIYLGAKKHMKTYRKRRQQFPLRFPRYGPRTKLQSAFEELWEDCTPTTSEGIKRPTIGLPMQHGNSMITM